MITEINRIKHELIEKIQLAVKPYLYKSNMGEILVPFKETFNLATITSGLEYGFEGFTESGLITDSAWGCFQVLDYESIAVEDLVAIDKKMSQLIELMRNQ